MKSPKALERERRERARKTRPSERRIRGVLGKDIIVYVRASDPSQKDSCRQQLVELEEELRWYGIELPPGGLPLRHDPENGVYMDDGISGWKRGLHQRPGSKALVEFVRGNRRRLSRPGTILVWDLSRLARFKRGPQQAIAQLYWFERHGWLVRSLTQYGLDSQDEHRVMRVLRVATESEKDTRHSEDKADNVHRGKKDNVVQGKWVGGRPPFGMIRCAVRRVGDQVQLVPMERRMHNGEAKGTTVLQPGPQAHWVTEIFRLYVDGEAGRSFSIRAIARHLNEQGVPTTDGAQWLPGTIHKILVNVHYTGRQKVSEEESLPAQWDPMVSQDLFDRAQARLEANKIKKRGANTPYSLSGLIFCAACNAPLWGDPGDGAIRYYRAKNATGVKACLVCRRRIQAELLEQAVFREIEAIAACPVVVEAIAAEQVREATRRSGAGEQIERIECEIRDRRRGLKRMMRAIVDGQGPAAELAAEVAQETNHEITLLERRRRDLLAGHADREAASEFARHASRFRDVYARATPAERKELVALFVVRITLDGPATATVHIRRPAAVE